MQVRQNIDIQGFTIDGHEIKISAYADDTKFLTINVHSMKLVLAICDTLQEFSSQKLNKKSLRLVGLVQRNMTKINP